MEVPGKKQDKGVNLCEPCQTESLPTVANGYCEECEEFMCNKSFQHHLKGKLCRHHVLTALTGIAERGKQPTQQTKKCKQHEGQLVRYYCRKHDVAGCGDCIVAEHGNCNPEFVKDLGKSVEESQDFKEILAKLLKFETDKNEIETEKDRKRQQNKILYDEALVEIKRFRKEINEFLDNAEKKIVQEVDKIRLENESFLKEIEQRLEAIRGDIEVVSSCLDKKFYQEDNLFIHMIEMKPKVRFLEKNLSDIQSKNKFSEFVFEAEEKLKDILKTDSRFGRVLKRQKEIETFNQGLDTKYKSKPTTDRPLYSLPDPRASGFFVGTKVLAWGAFSCTVTGVDPTGYVEVNVLGLHEKLQAGFQGKFDVELA